MILLQEGDDIMKMQHLTKSTFHLDTSVWIIVAVMFIMLGRGNIAMAIDASSTQAVLPSDASTNTGETLPAPMQEEPAPLQDTAEQGAAAPQYEYQVASRPDPFKPFITLKSVNPNELLDEEAELTGMQLFEPAQLSLVAVMDTPRGRIAMVEDVTKKGYKITVGQLIGRHGQVTEIQKEQVKVTETAQTRGGEKIKTDVFMKLKRDGEGK